MALSRTIEILAAKVLQCAKERRAAAEASLEAEKKARDEYWPVSKSRSSLSESVFLIFSKLVTELRLKIWEQALPSGPTFVTITSHGKHLRIEDEKYAIYNTNKEARKVVLKTWRPSFGANLPRPVLFNAASDTLMFTDLASLSVFLEVSNTFSHVRNEGLKYLAIHPQDSVRPCPKCEGFYHCHHGNCDILITSIQGDYLARRSLMTNAIRRFGGLEELLFIHECTHDGLSPAITGLDIAARTQRRRYENFWAIQEENGVNVMTWDVPHITCCAGKDMLIRRGGQELKDFGELPAVDAES